MFGSNKKGSLRKLQSSYIKLQIGKLDDTGY